MVHATASKVVLGIVKLLKQQGAKSEGIQSLESRYDMWCFLLPEPKDSPRTRDAIMKAANMEPLLHDL